MHIVLNSGDPVPNKTFNLRRSCKSTLTQEMHDHNDFHRYYSPLLGPISDFYHTKMNNMIDANFFGFEIDNT